jgi:hypothetical protein
MAVEMTQVGEQSASQTSARAAQEVSQGIIDRAASESTVAVPSQSSKLIEFFNAIKANGLSTKTILSMSAISFAANDGFTNLANLIYAAATHRMDASMTQLEEEDVVKWINIVGSLFQAIIAMAAMNYGFKGSSGKALLEQFLGKIENLSQVATVARGAQCATMGANVVSSGLLSWNSFEKGDLTKRLGGVTAQLIITKMLAEAAKKYEKHELELFSTNLEQQVRAIHTMVRKNGEAEREAAKVLQEAAV